MPGDIELAKDGIFRERAKNKIVIEEVAVDIPNVSPVVTGI